MKTATTLNIVLFGIALITSGMWAKESDKNNSKEKLMQKVIDTLMIQNREFGRVFKEAREACREEGKKACRSCVYFEMYNLREK